MPDRFNVLRLLNDYKKANGRQQKTDAAEFRRLKRKSRRLATLWYLALPALHDDDGTEDSDHYNVQRRHLPLDS